MDSLSQIALGAAVCGIVTAKPIRRALVYGAVIGTLPDLDVLAFGHLDPLQQFVRHRSFSHSLFVLSALALPLAWLLRRLDRNLHAVAMPRWGMAVWLALITHPLLDACTVYGTQLWWPLMPSPTAWSNVFIIDPLYTVPLVIAVLVAWRLNQQGRARRSLVVGLILAHAYLAFGLVAKWQVERSVERILADRGQSAVRVLATPAPFTTLLWRVLVRTTDGHQEGWYSLLRRDPDHFQPLTISTDRELRAMLPPIDALKTMEWFTRDYLKVEVVGDRLQVADLRMGAEPDYFFAFVIAQRDQNGWQPITPERVALERARTERLGEVFDRL